MKLIDTHTHLYLDAFDEDREEVVQKAIDSGVEYMLLPNIDSSSITSMLKLADMFPRNCLPMMGLHPTSVKENWEDELEIIAKELALRSFVAIGEIGIDLYWDQSFKEAQEEVFRRQVVWASERKLPVSIHSRDSIGMIIDILTDMALPGLKGVFHCFTGSREQAAAIIEMGFHMGIGGVVSFNNSGLCTTLKGMHPEHFVLETDAPFLAPVPFRSKRNDSSHIPLINNRLADCLGVSPEEMAAISTDNARGIFGI